MEKIEKGGLGFRHAVLVIASQDLVTGMTTLFRTEWAGAAGKAPHLMLHRVLLACPFGAVYDCIDALWR